jgi:magnesium chelatase subunit D
MSKVFPFSALVGQEQMKTALLLNAVDPSIGGVLIRGHKGTAKSTAARALATLLPDISVVQGCPYHCSPNNPREMHEECLKRFKNKGKLPEIKIPVQFVELPLSATEDRIVGTLHIEHALITGERRFEQGLLASANRGILYIDEANLLDDHLVDMILDAASSGWNIVEREGISFQHPSRFILIGTMNPEEGELRPQLLDRFGLCVSITGLTDPDERKEIAKRRIGFERNPEEFVATQAHEEKMIAEQIVKARKRLTTIKLKEEMWDVIIRICSMAEVQGHRADITMVKTATALAAFLEYKEVTQEVIIEASLLVLPHRMKNVHIETPEKQLEKIKELIKIIEADENREDSGSVSAEFGDDIESSDKMQVPGAGAVGSILFTFLKKKAETIFAPKKIILDDIVDIFFEKSWTPKRGLTKKTLINNSSGQYIRAEALYKGEKPSDIAIDATLRKVALRQVLSGNTTTQFSIKPWDLMKKVRRNAGSSLIIFSIDSSDSMSIHSQMALAKGAIISLLAGAGKRRDRVALLTFRDRSACVVLPPTASIPYAQKCLYGITTGGTTPLASGLSAAWKMVKSEKLRWPYENVVLIILSDGEANIPINNATDCIRELETIGVLIQKEKIHCIVIDTNPEPLKHNEMKRIAGFLDAAYYHINEIGVKKVVEAIRIKK